VTPAGHRARTSYKCDIKILKLQIDSTGYSGIRKKAKDLAEKKGDFVLIDVREKDEIAEDGGANTDHGGGG
jgi:2,3-bisphosphoglycerate-independent phosphoglycerate mutase